MRLRSGAEWGFFSLFSYSSLLVIIFLTWLTYLQAWFSPPQVNGCAYCCFCSRTVTERVCFKLKCSWFFTGRGSVKRNFWKKQLWWVSSCSEPFRLLGWQAENTASQQGSPSEQYPFGYRFSELLFLGVPGTATEQVQTCGLTRNSSRFDKTPKMRDSVRLNSLQIFLVTLPSFSSETLEMYFWTIPRSSVFCDWLFLVFSGVSLETATISLLILNVVMILREKLCQFWRLNWFFDL